MKTIEEFNSLVKDGALLKPTGVVGFPIHTEAVFPKLQVVEGFPDSLHFAMIGETNAVAATTDGKIIEVPKP